MENKFFSFLNPFLNWIDKGHFFRKPFYWIYTVLAFLNLLFPIFLSYVAVIFPIFGHNTKLILVFTLIWFVIALVSWFNFQIFWQRRKQIFEISKEGEEFIVVRIIAHFIQTLGETFGLWVGIVGSFIVLQFVLIGSTSDLLEDYSWVIFFQPGLLSFLATILIGFFIIVITRFIAEQMRALVSIANKVNTIHIHTDAIKLNTDELQKLSELEEK